MCTLVVLWQVYPTAPLVLALNRDEMLARKTAPIARWTDEPIVGGRDLESGGTWFGVGDHVVAGLTNHRSGLASPRGNHSRGALVVDALRQTSLGEVRRSLQARDMGSYGGFHLLACDEGELSVFSNRDGALEETRAEPGVHVLGNFGLDNAEDPVVATLRPAVSAFLSDEEPEEAELAAFLKGLLARHGPGWPCVHFGPFGTRSSTLLFSRERAPRLEVTDGPACESPWRDVSALLAPTTSDLAP